MSPAWYRRRDKRTVYENAWLRFEAHDIVHPTGVAGEHGVVVTAPASAVVLIDGDDVLLVRQPRFAVDALVLEVVKGARAPGETALDCAIRESREEAGVAAARWLPLGSAYEIPSVVEQPVALFAGIGLARDPLAPEDIEQIVAVRMPFDDACDACFDGRIDDAISALALMRARRALGR